MDEAKADTAYKMAQQATAMRHILRYGDPLITYELLRFRAWPDHEAEPCRQEKAAQHHEAGMHLTNLTKRPMLLQTECLVMSFKNIKPSPGLKC